MKSHKCERWSLHFSHSTRRPSSLSEEHIGNVALCQWCLFVCVYWEGNTRGQGTSSGAMGGPLTASDLQTHQHATESHSSVLVAPPPMPSLFSHALWRGLSVTVGGWADHTRLSSLASRAPQSQKLSFCKASHWGAWHHSEACYCFCHCNTKYLNTVHYSEQRNLYSLHEHQNLC